MTSHILDIIVEQKHREIEVLLQTISEPELKSRALAAPRRPRHFLERLRHPGPCGINIIAEIKRASPSRGILRADLDPAHYAQSYESGGAACLSVLTDRKFFQGNPEDLQAARLATQLPVLRKDFLIAPCQVYESCLLGADAVLLIARILKQDMLKRLLEITHELGMDALVEVHSESDMASAVDSGARLIGINNRNLQTFDTDMDTSIRMASLLTSEHIPIAASGVQNRDDIERIQQQSGIFNFLIGESLVKAGDPAGFLKTLITRSIP
jgi:indole-3-glycerol phosphate synthase